MDLLTSLIYATVAIIALVVVHGFYRKWRDRRDRVVVKLERNLPQADVDLELLPNSELPNGGARSLVRDNEPVIPRKRYQLKDGRDKVRVNEAELENVPLLMDPLEIEETEIEHANVFVTAETIVHKEASDFADEELAPEVFAGLDHEFHESQLPAAADSTASTDGTRAIDETGLDDEDDYEDDREQLSAARENLRAELDDEQNDEFDDEGDNEEQDDEFVAVKADELSSDDEFNDEFSEEFEGEFEEDEEPAAEVAANANADHDAADEELTDDASSDDDYEDEEYDPYEDENFYENEPALLENAYKLATSRFHRQPEPEAPRIEPGFGEPQADEVETAEEFVSALNEDEMDEFLDKEQEEIRAWRNQSVTQQNVPPAPPVPQVAPAPAPTAFEARAVRESTPAFTARVAPPVEPIAPVRIVAEEVPKPKPSQPSAPVASPKAAEPAKEHKAGFWQAMTGKSAKPVVTTTAKIAQGELFHAEASAPQLPPPPQPVYTGPQEVVVVNVMAKPGQYFYGDEMLPVLQHYGLRLGQMNIFHRHSEVDGMGPVMFSMANMVKPGTFALNSIEDFATPGISFFVQLPNRHGNMKAFEHMLATANGVKNALDGVLKDERRSVLTRQTVEHCRQRIRDFELALLAKK